MGPGCRRYLPKRGAFAAILPSLCRHSAVTALGLTTFDYVPRGSYGGRVAKLQIYVDDEELERLQDAAGTDSVTRFCREVLVAHLDGKSGPPFASRISASVRRARR